MNAIISNRDLGRKNIKGNRVGKITFKFNNCSEIMRVTFAASTRLATAYQLFIFIFIFFYGNLYKRIKSKERSELKKRKDSSILFIYFTFYSGFSVEGNLNGVTFCKSDITYIISP